MWPEHKSGSVLNARCKICPKVVLKLSASNGVLRQFSTVILGTQ